MQTFSKECFGLIGSLHCMTELQTYVNDGISMVIILIAMVLNDSELITSKCMA